MRRPSTKNLHEPTTPIKEEVNSTVHRLSLFWCSISAQYISLYQWIKLLGKFLMPLKGSNLYSALKDFSPKQGNNLLLSLKDKKLTHKKTDQSRSGSMQLTLTLGKKKMTPPVDSFMVPFHKKTF
jgi:hypothetical protein